MIFELVKKVVSNSEYLARTWDYETAVKYIFNINGNILEAGFFIHFKDNKIVKKVVELPVSYGCPINCRHCASSEIYNIKGLEDINIIDMCEYIMNDNLIKGDEPFLLTYSGIGEGAIQKNAIASASKILYKKYKKIYFNISTIGLDNKFISFCEKLSKEINVHHLQITYLHYDTKELSVIVPMAEKYNFNFKQLVDSIKNTNQLSIRFNYILINGYNDSLEHWTEFIKLTQLIKNRIIVRVSKINQTEVSRMNNIDSPSINTLHELESILLLNGFNTHIFTPENVSNNMNCGQLLWQYNTKEKDKI